MVMGCGGLHPYRIWGRCRGGADFATAAALRLRFLCRMVGGGVGNEDPVPTEGGVGVLAGLAGPSGGRRGAARFHTRTSSSPRWPVMRKLFPRVPHVKDPIGDNFQNERMVRAARGLARVAGSGAARPARGSGLGAHFPLAAGQHDGQGRSPPRRGSGSPLPRQGVPCPDPCAIRGFPGRTCRPLTPPRTRTHPHTLRPAGGLGPGAGEPGRVYRGPGAGVGGTMKLMQVGASFFCWGGRTAGPGGRGRLLHG